MVRSLTLFILLLCLNACAQPMRADAKLDLHGTFAIEGPIQMQLSASGMAHEGTYISKELMGFVKVNETTGEWVLAVFGEPDFKSTLSDGTEIWRWSYRPLGSEAALVRLFDKQKEEDPQPQPVTNVLQVRDGKVIAKWQG